MVKPMGAGRGWRGFFRRGKKCPKGLCARFCQGCSVGTYKDVGSYDDLCTPCSLEKLPMRAFLYVLRGDNATVGCPWTDPMVMHFLQHLENVKLGMLQDANKLLHTV